ncbi:YbfB/YjiJ family MFS transporter [Vibrio proteolyticus]
MAISKTTAALLVGVNATLMGIGLSRFAFTPLIPALAQGNWFTSVEAGYLGASNLLGYLIGALLAHKVSERFGSTRVLLVSALAVGLAYLVCFTPFSFWWFALWRCLSGIGGGMLIVVGPSFALLNTPERHRNTIGTMIFMGIGLGVVISAVVMPFLLSVGLTQTWLMLGLMALLSTLLCGVGLRRLYAPTRSEASRHTQNEDMFQPGLAAWLVILAYGFDAAGFIPHTIFWVDYIAAELNQGTKQALWYWSMFGFGTMSGPLIANLLLRVAGWRGAIVCAFIIKTSAVAIPVFILTPAGLAVSSFLVGAMIPGVVSLTSGRLAELVGVLHHKKMWGLATAMFALIQALSGSAMSAFFDWQGVYAPLFPVAAMLMGTALLLVVVSNVVETRSARTAQQVSR